MFSRKNFLTNKCIIIYTKISRKNTVFYKHLSFMFKNKNVFNFI